MQGDGREVRRIVLSFLLCQIGYPCSTAELVVHAQHPLHYKIGFSCDLLFDVKEVSIALCMDNPISSSPPQVLLARLFILEINSVSYLKIWCRMVCWPLCVSEPIFIHSLLGYG